MSRATVSKQRPGSLLTAALCSLALGTGIAASAENAPLVVIVDYDRGPVWEFLFGRNWRAIWSTPAAIPVFDLEAIGGGLRAVRTVGQHQTRGLVLEGSDGRTYTFRSLAKGNFVPGWLDWSLARGILADQASGNLPAADLVAARLAKGVGVPMTERVLGVLPDDARLGRFRDDFQGVAGTISEYPLAGDGEAGTFGASQIIDSESLWERARSGAEATVDARVYLRARLLDWWVADFDRHPEQWRWAEVAGRSQWQPISEDHDHAFPRYEGVLTAFVRLRNPWLLGFDDDYHLEGLLNNSRPLDAWLLAGLDREDWEEEVASFVEQAKAAGAIGEAVDGLPASWRAIAGDELAEILHARLERLGGFARDVYESLAEVIAFHGSDRDDLVEFDCRPDGALAATFHRGDDPHPLQRVIDPRETRRVEIYWYDGSDRITRNALHNCGLEVLEHEGRDVPLVRGVPPPPETGRPSRSTRGSKSPKRALLF